MSKRKDLEREAREAMANAMQCALIVELAIEWEALRSPMRYLGIHDRDHEITEEMWARFHEVECELAEAVWKITGKPSIPPEAWRSTFKVIEGGDK
jgi:hypothetical protein